MTTSNPPYSKLLKCKSLQSFHPPAQTDRTHNPPPTRPKFETIKPVYKHKNSEIDSDNGNGEMEGLRSLARVGSVDQLARMREVVGYESIVDVYRKENQNLKQQNKYLIREIKKRQKNEEVLNNYIDQLRKQIKNMQRSRANSPQLSPISRSKILSHTKVPKNEIEKISHYQYHYEPTYQKSGYEGDTLNTMYEIDELNERFKVLMDQCSKETCRRTRNVIRGKLAETAEKMRNFRKEFNIDN